MITRKRLPESGLEAKIIVRTLTKNRLATTCFRGARLKLAGNLSEWCSVDELFSDADVLEQFLRVIDETALDEDVGTSSCTLEFDRMIGWASTDNIENYDPSLFEEFQPNRHSTALRIQVTRTGILAPRTNRLTLVYEFKFEDEVPTVVVHSIYPGNDVGELRENVSDREGCVFFDWNHPGM